jgi:RHS repeat-associated protein
VDQGGYIMGVKANGAEETSTGFYLRNAFGKMESGSTAAASLETHTGLGFAGAGTPTSAGGGYVYLRNRWYDPQTGRFLSQDPIGLAGGVNLYAYAGNNPVAYSDPFGLMDCSWDKPTECKLASLTLSLQAFGYKAKGQLGPLQGDIGFKIGSSTGIALTGEGLESQIDATASASLKGSVGSAIAGGSASCKASTVDCSVTGSGGVGDATGSAKATTKWAVGGETTWGRVTVGAEIDVKGTAIVIARGVYDGAKALWDLTKGSLGLGSQNLDEPVIQLHDK